MWRCQERRCPVVTYTETHCDGGAAGAADPPAVVWPQRPLTDDDTTANALARRLHVVPQAQAQAERRLRLLGSPSPAPTSSITGCPSDCRTSSCLWTR